MNKKRPNFQKKGLTLHQEEEDPLAQSIYSQIGPDGLKFIKDDIKVSKEGLIKMIDENNNEHVQPLTKDDIEIKEGLLGKGAAGQVKMGIYKPLNIPVAIKTINALDREKRHQLMNDIKLLLQNKIKAEKEHYHCNFIVQLYGAFYEEGSVKVILELMDIGSLEDVVKYTKNSNNDGGSVIEEEILARISQQILNGLMFLHIIGHQIHRDIKPANILINSKGEVKLTDFGISKELEESNQFANTFLGTLTYMSPERIEGKKYNHLSDIWSFGMVILEMAFGKYPYPADKTYFEMVQLIINDPAPEIPKDNKEFSDDFKNFINLCLQKDVKKRASAIELLGHPWILKNGLKDIDLMKWINATKLEYKKRIANQQEQESKVEEQKPGNEKAKLMTKYILNTEDQNKNKKNSKFVQLEQIDELN